MHKSFARRGFAVLMAVLMVFTTLVFAATAEDASALESGSYVLDAKLSCFISAMGGVEFGGVYDSAALTKNADGTALLTVNFKTTPMTIYGISFDEFVDAEDPATIGYYDANGVLHTAADENSVVAFTASTQTVKGPQDADRHYVTSMTFPVTEDMNEITMWIYINSTVMGLQFCDGNGAASTNAPAQQTKYKGTLILDWSSIKKVLPINARLSCFISAMGGVEFGEVFDSANLLKGETKSALQINFKTTPMTIYGISFDEFVDAEDPATIGFYDTNGVLHTAADENSVVTFTASTAAVKGPQDADRHYVTSMTFPVTEDMNEITMWIYINSTVMGLQFSDGNGTASTNAPAQQTKYKGTLTLDWCSAIGHDYKVTAHTDATCTQEGSTSYTCTRDDSHTYDEAIPAKGHSFGQWQQTKASTEYDEGEEARTCTACDTTETRSVATLPRTELTLNKTDVTLTYKQSDTLTASEAVTWKSSNEKVVKVNENGKLTTVGKGTATITANSVRGEKETTCKVTVKYTWWQMLIRIFLFGFLWY